MNDIKYTELIFKIKFQEEVILPKYKVLMLNGALLNTLLSMYCINERECHSCSIVSKCLMQKLLGDNYEANKPLILQSHNILPYYLIDCSDKRRSFSENQELSFSIRLINEAIDYISQFIYAFDQLGSIGLGERRAKYYLTGIYNKKNNPILEKGILYENNVYIESICDYISSRKPFIKDTISLAFITPFQLDQISSKFYLSTYNLCYSVINRLYKLNGTEKPYIKLLDELDDDKEITDYNLNIAKQSYPIKKLGKKKTIIAFKGKLNLPQENYNLIDYLIACEKMCIGKHIILGYGRFIIEGEGQYAGDF